MEAEQQTSVLAVPMGFSASVFDVSFRRTVL